jgi:tripartite-type tricarboxylate transporter receptor subunit TctC
MKRTIAAIVLAAAFAATAASAQTYPDRPIKMVVPFAPGGAVDSLARIIGARMQEQLKQPVIVENRPGAGGNIAAMEVTRAPADGYTMLLTTVGHAISPSINKSLPYDPIKGFTPVEP